jgi:hypothetical protein
VYPELKWSFTEVIYTFKMKTFLPYEKISLGNVYSQEGFQNTLVEDFHL